MDEVIRDCQVEAEIRGCRIAVNGRLDGQVMGNRELLRRAVENVLRNGIRYAPEQSTIEVSIAEDSRLRDHCDPRLWPGCSRGCAYTDLRSILPCR